MSFSAFSSLSSESNEQNLHAKLAERMSRDQQSASPAFGHPFLQILADRLQTLYPGAPNSVTSKPDTSSTEPSVYLRPLLQEQPGGKLSDSSSLPRFISLSGGGWNSHSMLAGMVAGSLDAQENSGQARSLSSLLNSVKGISANSGGTWFLTMLAFSNDFRNALESRSQADQYNTTGFNGQTRNFFQGIINSTSNSVDAFSSIPFIGNALNQAAAGFNTVKNQFDYYLRLANAVGNTGINWRNIVEQVVFKPYNMFSELSGISLEGQRQSWAADKDLLYASALQTTPVVMDNQGILGGKVFASVSPAKGNPTAQFTPVTIASLVNAPGNAPQAKVILNGGQSTFGYTNNAVFFPPNPVNNLVDAQLDGASLNVIDPTIASSAAVAGYAAPNSWNSLLPGSILSPLHNELAYFARDLSPLAQVQGGAFKMPRSLPSSSNLYSAFTNISGGGYTRVADGGYVDNMSAAYMLRNIQDKYGAQDPVHLTIFANKSEDPVTGVKMLIAPDGQKSAYGIADDVAELFGNMYGNNSDGDTVGYDGFGLKLNTLSSKIFDPVAWYGKEKPDWNYNSGNVDISYFKLDAKTVDNAAFGVKGGQAVNLGIFVASNSKSGAAPILSSYLDSYDANYDVYRQAISDPVLGGYAYIKDAFGILA